MLPRNALSLSRGLVFHVWQVRRRQEQQELRPELDVVLGLGKLQSKRQQAVEDCLSEQRLVVVEPLL
jgi:hypothetical protein